MNEDTYEGLREATIKCLVIYGNLGEAEAIEKVDHSPAFQVNDPSDLDPEKGMLFHETAYFWAMHILHHENNRHWYKDPKLWPPPEEYFSPEWPNNVAKKKTP